MSTQTDTLRASSALPEDPFALVARARAMQSVYLRGLAAQAFASVQNWLVHRRTIAAVEDLSPRMLADIGIDVTALRAGVVRRSDAEYAADMGGRYMTTTAPAMTNAAEPHLRAAVVNSAANSDVRRAA